MPAQYIMPPRVGGEGGLIYGTLCSGDFPIRPEMGGYRLHAYRIYPSVSDFSRPRIQFSGDCMECCLEVEPVKPRQAPKLLRIQAADPACHMRKSGSNIW